MKCHDKAKIEILIKATSVDNLSGERIPLHFPAKSWECRFYKHVFVALAESPVYEIISEFK